MIDLYRDFQIVASKCPMQSSSAAHELYSILCSSLELSRNYFLLRRVKLARKARRVSTNMVSLPNRLISNSSISFPPVLLVSLSLLWPVSHTSAQIRIAGRRTRKPTSFELSKSRSKRSTTDSRRALRSPLGFFLLVQPHLSLSLF